MLKELYSQPETKNVIKWHHYLDIYEEIFSALKGEELKILEIGVLDGGSLKLWRDYFGDRSTIVGIDIHLPKTAKEIDGVYMEIGDQSDPVFIANLVEKYGDFDIVIDDGGHTNRLVGKSFELLFRHTKILYVVEDTHALLWYFGLHSLARDLYMALLGNRNFVNRIRSFFDIFIDIIKGNYFFYRLSSRLAKKITHMRHPRPYRVFERGEKIAFNDPIITEDIQGLYSLSFYDSLIVFRKRKLTNCVVEFK